MTLRLFSFLALCAFLFGPAVPHSHGAEQLYTCGMHPQIIKTEPGNCPICGMKLTPVRAGAKSAAQPGVKGERVVKFYRSSMIPGEISQNPGKDSMGMERVPVYADEFDAGGAITIDPVTIQKMNLKTDVVATGPVRRSIRAVGTVAFNEQGLTDITTKYEGWIEKLLVNATWTVVKAGDPLFEIYSPDLYNAQLNYLVALRSGKVVTGALMTAARARLRLFDVPDEFVEEITRKGEPRRTFVYRAPSDGIVIEKAAVQGMMVKPGERIFRLVDLSTVWVTAQIYEKDVALVREGQAALIRSSYGEGRDFQGKVEQVIPEVVAETRTAQARLVIPNPDHVLKPGMFVDVRLEAELTPSAVLVPDVAVLRSGERNTVFVVRDAGTFEPRLVKLGARTEGNRYEVLSGLAAGERVVTSGQFMLDSESQLREAIQKMTNSVSRPAPASGAGQVTSAPANESKRSDGTSVTVSDSPALRELSFATADAAAPLAADDAAGYAKQRPAVNTALKAFFAAEPHAAHGPLAAFKDGLPAAADLPAARRDFEPFSTAVADLARSAHLQHTAGLHVFECPMAPATGKARWLQRAAGTKNPFFGSQMPTCGDEIDANPTAAPAPAVQKSGMLKLPPGHPPVGAMSMKDFLHSQTGTPVVAAGTAPESSGCGGCGISAAAMAAGEPCEHDAPTKAASRN